MYQATKLEEALVALGDVLADLERPFTVVAIGGGALALQGLIARATEDIDLVGLLEADRLVSGEPLPPQMQTAIADVARVLGLHPKWMNSEPTSLLRLGLPDGFLQRCQRRVYGGLTVLLASRHDQIHLKLLAVSRPGDKHHRDLQTLAPTQDELLSALRWARTQTTGEGAELELRAILATFGLDQDDG